MDDTCENTKTHDGPDPIDTYVGLRIRARRKEFGLTQTTLGQKVGVTFQQIQKYERGTNRVGSSRLFKIAKTLKIDVGYFFEGADDVQDTKKKNMCGAEYYNTEEGQRVAEIFGQIKEARKREQLVELAKLFI